MSRPVSTRDSGLARPAVRLAAATAVLVIGGCRAYNQIPVYSPPPITPGPRGTMCVKAAPPGELRVHLEAFKGWAQVDGGWTRISDGPLAEVALAETLNEMRALGFDVVMVATDREALDRGCSWYFEGVPSKLHGKAYASLAGDYSVIQACFARVLAVHVAGGRRIVYDGTLCDDVPSTKIGHSLVDCSLLTGTCRVADIRSARFLGALSVAVHRSLRIILGLEAAPAVAR